ncbi:MAG: hypothetical protein V4515_12510 [Chloroflexota bacterium]
MTLGRGEGIRVQALGDSLDRLRAAAAPLREVPGWATIDLDRAQTALSSTLGRPLSVSEAADDLLGASARHLRLADGQEVVLLEPSTEGRLAAALARHGEGIQVLYLLVGADGLRLARDAGFALTDRRPGPFGSERLILGGPRWGPFLILAGRDSSARGLPR